MLDLKGVSCTGATFCKAVGTSLFVCVIETPLRQVRMTSFD